MISAYIFTFSLFRNYAYEVALTEQVTVKFDGGLALTQVILGYLLAIIGGVLVVSSSWALGIIGTYNGDYFDILMEERITQVNKNNNNLFLFNLFFFFLIII